jgi:hypothetical protein
LTCSYLFLSTESVSACINGTAESDRPETIGVTVVELGGGGIVKEIGSGVWHVHNTGSVGFWEYK